MSARHLILGAGPAGVIAAETLRRLDADAAITIVGDEPERPYSRMALPYLLAENVGEDGTHLRHAADHYERLNIEVRQGRAAKVRPDAREVDLESGDALGYDRLLVATGSHAIRPPFEGADLPGIENCWTLDDARRIAAGAKKGDRVVLLGAGFIGCIVLQALVERGVKLTVIEMADRMLARMMDATGGDMMKCWCEKRGVTVLTGTRVEGIEKAKGGLALAVGDGRTVEADLVVCATGVKPNTAFLDGSGVELNDGVLVDNFLRTSVDGIYAAGDVAEGPDLSTGKHAVHAIQPTASEHGRIAARNMAGHETRYAGSLSMNVLNTLGLISSSFGLWDGAEGGEQALAVDADRFRYLRLEFAGDHLVGALALGLTQHVGVVRGLIQTRVPLGPWKARLLANPHRVMEAYLERTQGTAAHLMHEAGAARASA